MVIEFQIRFEFDTVSTPNSVTVSEWVSHSQSLSINIIDSISVLLSVSYSWLKQ